MDLLLGAKHKDALQKNSIATKKSSSDNKFLR